MELVIAVAFWSLGAIARLWSLCAVLACFLRRRRREPSLEDLLAEFSRRAFMAQFWQGTPTMIDYIPPTTAVNSGDVVVVNNTPFVCHRPIAVGALGSLAAGGGAYIMAADAAYGNGVRVVWDTVKQQVSTNVTTTAYDFGVIVGGPLYQLSDGGPTGAAILCLVYHCPTGETQGGLGLQVASALQANFRNLLDGGDATTNPWQRGTSFSSIAGSLIYTADRIFCIANAASAAQFSQSADTNVAGFADFFKWGRPSANTDTHAITIGQALETLDSIRCQSQPITLSFWAKKGANYSGGALTVQVLYSTTAGNDTAAHLAAASTNWSSGSGGGYVINATQALTTTETRYEFTGSVPAGCTQLGFLITWTPTGTAGADDNVYANGLQLEIGNGATPYEKRDVQVELEICQRYFYQISEPGSGVVVGPGMITAAAVQSYILPMPTQMRIAPTVTVSVGTFKVNLAGTATTPTTFAAGTTHTPNYITVTSANTGQTAGQATLLQGGGGSGYIQASADL